MATESEQLVGIIDIDTETAPNIGKERLYRLWEEGSWSARALDFTQDAIDWREKLTEKQRKTILWNYAMFLDGEESVTITLAPFLEAVTRHEDRIYLATQVADEARHHVFFDRFLREVCGIGNGYSSTLAETRPQLTWGYLQVFGELDRISEQIRRFPRQLHLLAQGITIYHVIVEGMLAHTGQHYLRDYVRRHQLFPGFAEGINFIARDESRHIAFGVQTLRELVTSSPECKRAAIKMLNRVLPWAAGVFTPPNIDWSYLTDLGYSPQEVYTFGLRSVETKIRRAGIDPSEVVELVKLGYTDSPSIQATRVITLIEGQILGTNQPTHVTEEALDVLFQSMCRLAQWTQHSHKHLQATIQWIFNDAQPRYLILKGEQQPVAQTGQASSADLTLHCSATDWARIAQGHLKQQKALLSRRLRISGDLRLALQLPRILPV